METKNRIIGLDLARAIAIIGMIVTHTAELSWVGKILSSGIASSLFAVVAGITMVIISERPGKITYLRLITRGLLVLLIGVALVSFAVSIQIILVIMGASMVLLFWVPKIRIQYQAILLVLLILAAAAKNQWTTVYEPYSMLGWLAFMVGGMILFQVLQNNKNRVIWGVSGLVITIVGLYARLNVEPPSFFSFVGHTGGVGNMILCLGASTAVLASCFFLGEKANASVLRPLTVFGMMSLTMYVAHVVSAEYLYKNIVQTSNIFALLSVVVGIIFAIIWAKFFKRGPLESLIRILIHTIVPTPARTSTDAAMPDSSEEKKQKSVN
ncbi:DUF418 domain-containing protein [Corynebacterium silvaticum]|uniref:DUF418 domain-containing protein n=1 Tax=Corynebacterium silvaticum TaxID=2320431 RepID=A0A7Y4LJR8_9CORY|nr:DUF418 domain-containing protein [Corynebacterium silvaticum]ARU46849.1 DUF418 domain-containing protein [Corynebacterium silvaticum]MBH5300758.1 DUF418 domain-containing protein [Corynebacterium silvaticum]NOM64957.1 DUF418 domain-containing protein [Corynebacterium silvaticum]NON70162.1 DUF418 domain-containing protein [Corynebacterium silvaticum]TFA91880.1 DUF418 domain-containing protein [Corynebacterium silvaticum]